MSLANLQKLAPLRALTQPKRGGLFAHIHQTREFTEAGARMCDVAAVACGTRCSGVTLAVRYHSGLCQSWSKSEVIHNECPDFGIIALSLIYSAAITRSTARGMLAITRKNERWF